jgi:hypothetical protein
MKKRLFPLILSLSILASGLAGCSMVPYYSQVKAVADTGIATAVEDRKDFNDRKLAVNLVALCDSSIGALNRYPDPQVRDFVDRLCGGDPNNITIDRLAQVLELVKQVNRENSPTSLPVIE